MRTEKAKLRILSKKLVAAVMAAASLCTMGCAKKTEDDTFVYIDIGYIDSEQEYIEKYGEDGTYVAISVFNTPEPVITPVPTPEPTPEPTRKPKSTKKPEKEEKDEKKDKEKDEDKKEESKEEASSTPKPKKIGSTPHSKNYERVSIDYESSSEGIKFETTTFGGDTVSESIFSRNAITMVNIWTQA